MTYYEEIFGNCFNKEKLLYKELMSAHTSFRVGGAADLLILPQNCEDITKALELCRNNSIKYYIVGNGSNLLVKDSGFSGVIIKLSKNFDSISILDDGEIHVQAGTSLSKLASFALANSLEGLEFASGIPGTFGGAVVMNAGAYGGEMKDVISSVELLDESGNLINLDNSEMNFGYRTSIVAKNKFIVISGKVRLNKGIQSEIKAKAMELNNQRRQKQPLELPSAGSAFKRPQNHFAAKLIEDAGLKGYSIGGAKVSQKHSGFIVNYNKATAADIITLIDYVKNIVYNKTGTMLEPEVKIIGNDTDVQ